MHHAKTVGEAAVLGGREDPSGALQLADAAKALHPRRVQQVLLGDRLRVEARLVAPGPAVSRFVSSRYPWIGSLIRLTAAKLGVGHVRSLASGACAPVSFAMDQDDLKRQAAKRAVELVEPGMVVGLGGGTTALLAVRRLGVCSAKARCATSSARRAASGSRRWRGTWACRS